ASLGPGGAERQLLTTIRGLFATGAFESLTLFAMSLDKASKKDFYLPQLTGLPLEICELKRSESRASLRDMPEVHAAFVDCFPLNMREPIAIWYREFLRRRPEVVHAWQDQTSLIAVVAALLAGVPRIVLSTRSTRPENPRRRLHRYMERAYKAVVGLPSVVLCNNSVAGARDYEAWLGLTAGTVRVVHNGIDFGLLSGSAVPQECLANRNRL